jgi:small subunit ribosomal protein S17
MICNDVHCPYHGHIKVRGKLFVGKVISIKRHKTVTVLVEHIKKIPKYERYARYTSKIHAHLPPCIKVEEGDIVEIGETRKISKTKSFVVLRVLKRGD